MAQIPPQSLADLLARLADNKYALGWRFSQWTNGAPALEASVAAAAMTQDELGHARSLYAALGALPDSPEAYLRDEKRERRFGLPLLGDPFGSWAEFVAASVLFDRALTLVFEAARESQYEPLRQRASKILQEEKFHRMYGEGWLKRLSGGAATQSAMQTAVAHWWRPTAEWLGSGYDGSLAADGTLAGSAESLRLRWMAEIKSLLSECGLMIDEQ